MEGSEALRATLAPIKDHLEQGDVDVNVPWMDPDNAEANRLRPTALEMVSLVAESGRRPQEGPREPRAGRASYQRFPRTVGWLAKENDGWQVKTGGVLPHEGDLWVIFPEGEAQRPGSRWEPSTRVQSSFRSIDEAMLEGTARLRGDPDDSKTLARPRTTSSVRI